MDRRLKNRGGFLLMHLIISIVIFMSGNLIFFFVSYLISVIAYEDYVYDLREKLKLNKE